MTVLGTPQQSMDTLPSVKWLTVGDQFVGRVVDAKFGIEDTDPVTSQPKLNARGKPKTSHLFTLHIMDATTAKVGDKTEKRAPVVGELVSLWVGGGDKYDSDNPQCFETVYEQHGEMRVGDVIKEVYVSDKPSNNIQPRKIKAFAMRHAKEDGSEAAAVQAAEQAHAERNKATPLGQATPAASVPAAPNLSDF